jgi:hypothetical protein
MSVMKRWLLAVFYLSCFVILSAVIYHLAVAIPPRPWELEYNRYRVGAVIIAAVIAALAIGGAVVVEIILREREEE